jgi:FkbM family methyltransferase
MIQKMLRYGRVTKFLPYVRGLGALRGLYELVLPESELKLRVDDFDGDLKLDVDVREYMGFNVWHRPTSFEKHERNLFCGAIVKGCTVLDVGANVGIYTLLAAKRGAKVFAVEADPQNVEVLKQHVHLNGFDDRVTIIHMAAAAKEGTVTLFRNPSNSGGSSIFQGVNPTVVPSNTIDSLNLPPIDVCKMDIEGAEMIALRGMNVTMQRSPNMKMLIEYNKGLGQSDGMMDFISARFASVYTTGKPGFRVKEPLPAGQKLPAFCNLWAYGQHGRHAAAWSTGSDK